ncbi:MAG TPA: urate oxidase, partial [Chloroflexia bacterium]|nr:urate oxidase [Chloroflexia bacterium]
TYATPLDSTPIPESAFTGRSNTLLAAEVDVEVFGDNFLAAYTQGDNSNVVATDTMKNFVLKQMVDYEGATLEGSLHYLGRRFLETYPQMHSLRMTGRERPFTPAPVPGDGEGEGDFTASNVLFSPSHGDYAFASFDMERADGGVRVAGHRCGRRDLQLIKVTGSSFASFLRDEHTTLPERKDRPLFIYLDVYWRYGEARDAHDDDLGRYIPAEQVRDLVQTVFHRFVSMSIQHLVYEMGTRLLERFPQMAEVTFEAQNRLWDSAFVSEADERIKVYTDPRPPYGSIKLTLGRDE